MGVRPPDGLRTAVDLTTVNPRREVEAVGRQGGALSASKRPSGPHGVASHYAATTSKFSGVSMVYKETDFSSTARLLRSLVQEDSAFANNARRMAWAEEWLYGISYLKRRVDASRRVVYCLRGPIVFGALLVPILATGAANSPGSPFWRWTTVGVSIVVALCTAIYQTVRPVARWRLVRQTHGAQEVEAWAFLERAGRYAGVEDDDERFRLLFDAVEAIWKDYERGYLAHIDQSERLPSSDGRRPEPEAPP